MFIRNGALRIFRLFGIDVFIHWSWLLIVLIDYQDPWAHFSKPIWNLLIIIGLFAIVLTHEFGHQLACRSVGGTGNTIILWPFGGIAFGQPPWKASAMLWTVVAGPLVNVVLWPVLFGLNHAIAAGQIPVSSDMAVFCRQMASINLILLVFNILPIYPLDGGKILWSLLWFVLGDGLSLQIASAIGIIGILLLSWYAMVHFGSIYLLVMGGFLLINAWQGYKLGDQLRNEAKRSRSGSPNTPTAHSFAHCPSCGLQPPAGDYFQCGKCNQKFDIFADHGSCPHCRQDYLPASITCPQCRKSSTISDWLEMNLVRSVQTVSIGPPATTTGGPA